MVTAEVLLPSSQGRKVVCSSCDLSYSAKDYKILYENKKLIYFKFYGLYEKKFKVICHDCLWKIIAEMSNGEPMMFRIIGEKDIYECEFDPDEYTDPSAEDDDMSDFFGFD